MMMPPTKATNTNSPKTINRVLIFFALSPFEKKGQGIFRMPKKIRFFLFYTF